MSGGKLCDLADGDLITILWSGQPRLVVIELFADATAILRDLTSEEQQALDEEYGLALDEEYGQVSGELRDLVLSVPCPECKRPEGVQCITLDTHEPTNLVHRARANAPAREAAQ